MVSLRAPGLGPIVGHTTDTTCRIWIRAGDPGDEGAELDEDRRTVGVIGLVQGNRVSNAWYFRLNREFDRTGSHVLGKDVQLGFYPKDFEEQGKPVPVQLPKSVDAATLTPDTEFTVRVGTLTMDDPSPSAARTPDWELVKLLPKIDSIKNDLLKLKPEESEARFRTFPAAGSAAKSMTFLLGSCRYPGLLFKIKDADRIFGPMQEHFKNNNAFGDRAQFTMMCGDQIYADVLNKSIPLLRADTYEEFQERYLSAFGAPNLRKLLRSATTYMILDDHEIEDNWTQDRISQSGKLHLFNIAINAYMSYQWSHGPRTWGRLLYYTFECAGYPFFVLDTRTQRFKNEVDSNTDKGLRDNHLLGPPSVDPEHPGQLGRLLEWLSQQQKNFGDRPKFIACSSVFAPNAMDERIDDSSETNVDRLLFNVNRSNRDASDGWPAFPQTRQKILERIVSEGIQNVVFLSGDIHCANVAAMEFERQQGNNTQALPLRMFSVTSSAFYWPFPFADGDPNGYVHDSHSDEQWDAFPVDNDTRMHYRSFGYTQEDNFARLDIDKANATLTVRVFDRNGRLIVNRQNDDNTKKRPLMNVLNLAPWR